MSGQGRPGVNARRADEESQGTGAGRKDLGHLVGGWRTAGHSTAKMNTTIQEW